MRVPLSWLKDYVDIDVPVEMLAHRLTLAGLEVGGIEYIGVPAGNSRDLSAHLAVPISTDHLVWDREKIVIGHIVEVKQHPDADRLVLAMVDSGIGQVEQCVTGAPNLFEYVGKGKINPPLVVAYAREGAELMDPYSDQEGARMRLKPKKLRGIENRTMVCSEKELGISDAHGGIMLLQIEAAAGTPLQDVLGDVILDIELTPNMARNYSIIGVAREVAALLDKPLKMPPLDVQANGPAIEGQVAIDIREPDLNPRFMVTLIKDVEIKDSPPWMQRRLRLAGMRPISNIVDITNYVMLETGQPLHAFDYDTLIERAHGKAPTIITRTAEPGERLTTLDDVDRELDPFTEMVADTAGGLSLAGIMGGLESEVEDGHGGDAEENNGKSPVRAVTRNVLLEAASWNFINVRKTLSAQRERGKEISSEAGVRFSRGVHPALAEVGLLRATEMMRELASGTVAKGVVDAYPRPEPTVTVELPLSEVERILGIALSGEEVADILTRLQFEVKQVGGLLTVTVPEHRLDIGYVNDSRDTDIADLVAQADLIEEIARVYGYDRIPNTLIVDELPPQRNNPSLVNEEKVRNGLAKAGLQEIITYRLTTPEAEARLVPPGAKSDLPEADYVRLANPSSVDKAVMRHTILNSMLEIAAANSRWQQRQALFEVGKVYLPVEGEDLPAEPTHLGLVLTGERRVPTWQEPADDLPLMDYYDLKGAVETLIVELHLESVTYTAAEHSSYFPGRVAALVMRGETVGYLGELHPRVREVYELPDQPVLVAEIDLDKLLADVPDLYPVQTIGNYPAVYQDIAVVVEESVPAAEVVRVIEEAGSVLLRDVRLFDVYRGEQIGANKKSLAYALTIQAPDKTLRDKDADGIRARIVKALKEKLSASLRE